MEAASRYVIFNGAIPSTLAASAALFAVYTGEHGLLKMLPQIRRPSSALVIFLREVIPCNLPFPYNFFLISMPNDALPGMCFRESRRAVILSKEAGRRAAILKRDDVGRRMSPTRVRDTAESGDVTSSTAVTRIAAEISGGTRSAPPASTCKPNSSSSSGGQAGCIGISEERPKGDHDRPMGKAGLMVQLALEEASMVCHLLCDSLESCTHFVGVGVLTEVSCGGCDKLRGSQ